MSGHFITGTGTDIGKTWLVCALLKHWRRQGRQPAGLGDFQVSGDQAEGRNLGPRQAAEAVERLDPLQPLDPRLAGRGFGQGLGHGLDQPASHLEGR